MRHTLSPYTTLFRSAQVVLGSAEFLNRLRKGWRGDERECSGLKRLRGLTTWQEVIAVVENLRGEPWERFRDRYGDWGIVPYPSLFRSRCALKLKELGAL